MTTIRIPDLREPIRTPEERQIHEMSLSMEVDLSVDSLVAAATRRTGLTDFGATGVLDRLALQVAAVDADAGLAGIGRYLVRRRLVGLLSARLRYEDYLRRHPEAHDIDLDPPVIVVGLPRSGTTHLVNLLAEDPRFRSLPFWELLEPIPVTGDGPGRDGVDPRYLRAVEQHRITREASPLTALMHDQAPSSIEEECELMDLDLCAYPLEWIARVPSWREHYLRLDQHAHYRFLREALQVLTHLRGPRRWVLKSPQHLEQLGPLMAAFPDATVAFTLRDPVAVLQSALTMLAYADRTRRASVDADELAAYWVDRIERLLRAAVRDAQLIPSGRRVDIAFHRFMADQVGAVTSVLHAAGLEVSDTDSARFDTYVGSHPRGRDGRLAYDLREDFGLDPSTVFDRYAFYFDAFPEVRREVH